MNLHKKYYSKGNFKIIACESDEMSLRIMESTYIFTKKAVLNEHSSAYPLKLHPT